MWFICLRKAIVPRDQWTTSVDEHLAWLKEMHDAGKIVFSGPGADPEGNRLGIYLIRASSRAEAEEVAAGDPFTLADHCAFDMIEWEVHQVMGAGPFASSGFGTPEPSPNAAGYQRHRPPLRDLDLPLSTPAAPARWNKGQTYRRTTGISPLLATWEHRDHPSQVRMRSYLGELSGILKLAELPSEPLYLELLIDVVEPARLARHYDLENYLTPVISHLGWKRFVMVRAEKRVGGQSEISVGSAVAASGPLMPPWLQIALDAGSGASTKQWKERLRSLLTANQVRQLPPGPVALDLAWRCSSQRNWAMLWKPTIDVMGPVLGDLYPNNPFNPADDRIVELTLHREVDDAMGHGIHVGMGWRSAKADG